MEKSLGIHVIIEMYDCNPDTLKNKDKVEEILLNVAGESNAHALGSFFHQFEPHGVSGVIIIEESHISIHTWPEHGYAAIDYFYCSDEVDIDAAIQLMKEEFEPKNLTLMELKRGYLPEDALYKYEGMFSMSNENAS